MTKRKTTPGKTEAAAEVPVIAKTKADAMPKADSKVKADTKVKTDTKPKAVKKAKADSKAKPVLLAKVSLKDGDNKETSGNKEAAFSKAETQKKTRLKSSVAKASAELPVKEGKTKKVKTAAPAAENILKAEKKSGVRKKGKRSTKPKTIDGKAAKPSKAAAAKTNVIAQLAVHRPEQPDVKLDAWYMELSSLNKSQVDPRGTMLVVRDKQHEIGIHVDQTNRNLLFSYFPKLGKGEVLNVPVSLHELIRFITQK